MGIITVSSGVHVGATTGTGPMVSAWFSDTPTAQFAPFTLAGVVRAGGPAGAQAVLGHADLGGPIAFEFERFTRDVLTTSLASVAVQELTNGRPKVSLGGWRDAVARSGRLVNLAWSERRNAGGTTAFNVWGVLEVVDASARAFSESMRVVLHPCDLLSIRNSGSWFASPSAYAELVELDP